MRSSKAKSGPFGERLHYALDEIDRICLEALRNCNCLPDAPSAIRIERFIEKHFDCDITYEDLGPGILGCTIFTQTGKVQEVLISSSLEDGTQPGERRLRSTLAHEGGHGLLHAHLFIQGTHAQDRFGFDAEQKPQDRVLCRASDIGGVESKRGYDGKWWEYQANRAIGGLLLPKKLVDAAVRGFIESDAAADIASIPRARRDALLRHISEVFDVNPVVARIRVGEMWPPNSGEVLL